MAENNKDASCFTLDGVVAEMVIEVDDSDPHKPAGFEEFKELDSSPEKNEKSNNDIKVQDPAAVSGELQMENSRETPKKIEDKIEAKNECFAVKNDDADKSKNLVKGVNNKFKRKRKRKQEFRNVEEKDAAELPRYPGRKRQANKKYFTEENLLLTSAKLQSHLKEISSGARKTTDANSCDTIKEENKSNDFPKEKRLKKETNEHLNKIESNVVEPKTKQDVLRKLPFRKNRDAPEVPDLKPKVIWWNGVGEGKGVKLGDITQIRKRIEAAKSVRSLFKILFYQWPANGGGLVDEIFKFNGFPFDENSFEFKKRKNLMKIMTNETVGSICEILGLQDGPKDEMISNILKFLLKPSGKIDPSKDPALQPVVVLERIVIDNKFFSLALEESSLKKSESSKATLTPILNTTPKRTTRNSLASLNIWDANISFAIESKPKRRKTSERSTSPEAKKPIAKEDIDSENLAQIEKNVPKTNEKYESKGSTVKQKDIKASTSKESLKTPISETPVLKSKASAKPILKSKISTSPAKAKGKRGPKPKAQRLTILSTENDKASAEEEKNDLKAIDSAKSSKVTKPHISSAEQVAMLIKKSNAKLANKRRTAQKTKKQSKSTLLEKEKQLESPAHIKMAKLKELETLNKAKTISEIKDTESLVSTTGRSESSADSSSIGSSSDESEEDKSTELTESDVSKKLKRKIQKLKKKLKETEARKKEVKDQSENGKKEKYKSDSDTPVNELKDKSGKEAIREISKDPFNIGESELDSSIDYHEMSLSIENIKSLADSTTEKNRSSHQPTLSDSSETVSADETKMVSSQRKPTKPKRLGKPLRSFPQISESIKNANFSALQRLHILLFGASDKAENLKANILAFGGFPFLEGSDEWKQKHFLLSLLAQNTLREYLNLLCIDSTDDDQPTMINKLMKFLAAPTENFQNNQICPVKEIETEVVSSELVNKNSPPREKPMKKRTAKKKEVKKGISNKYRKVLMSEEEARRMEANFAREQRALARESKISILPMPGDIKKPEVITTALADPNQLNALLQTVYRRRALKAAGAVISTPNKGIKTKLGNMDNVKFLVVTSNYRDLEILHRLIYMCDAAKGRIRKNILDFDGFGFNEDSDKYKERMDFLTSLGYEVSKRISFLLGLCPLQTDIPQQDLNELIMYFLMSPCKTKQVVPITQMPENCSLKLPTEYGNLVIKPVTSSETPSYKNIIKNAVLSPKKNNVSGTSNAASDDIMCLSPVSSTTSSSVSSILQQKAKKSLTPTVAKPSPVKKILLPSTMTSTLSTSPVLNISNLPQQSSTPKIALLNPSIISHNNVNYGMDKNTETKVPLINTGTKFVQLGTNINVARLPTLNAPAVGVLNMAKLQTSSVPGKILPNQILFPNLSKLNVQPSQSVLKQPSQTGSVVSTPSSPPELLIQQQTPDGKQKTFKLIRLPPDHPFASAVTKPGQQPAATASPQILLTSPSLARSLPSNILLMKNKPNLQLQSQNSVPLKLNMPGNKVSNIVLSTGSKIQPSSEEFVLPDQGESASNSATNDTNDPEVEILNPLEENPPTDAELYTSIQEIIHSSNFEDITLRNVIEKVSAQFPHHDLTSRHNYMKDCVKKIIIGT